MTGNQIAYYQAREGKRHNQATEQETHRDNVVRSSESERHNRATEEHNVLVLNETKRSNVARETETQRSNMAKEAETNRANLAKERETHRSNVAREVETNRHNLETEVAEYRRNLTTLRGQDLTKVAADQKLANDRLLQERDQKFKEGENKKDRNLRKDIAVGEAVVGTTKSVLGVLSRLVK